MGYSQSKPVAAPAIEEKLIERLQAMRTSVDNEDGFVDVEKEAPPSYTPYAKEVSLSTALRWEKQLLSDPKNRLALSALSSNDASAILTQRSTNIADVQRFNVTIPFEGAPITNQAASGRCWIFASTNVFRVAIMRKYGLSEFELSQSYLFYWDKLEKANYFLEQIIDTAGEDLEERLVQQLLSSPVGDGGQWTMISNLVTKYGLVPKDLYPDSFNASSSATMDRLITTKLREDALRLRTLKSKDSASIGAIKAKMLQEIHLILTLMLGPPPNPNDSFKWDYYDKDSKFHSLSVTPKEFASSLSSASAVRANGGTDIHKLFSIVNDPRNDYGSLLTVSRLGNVSEGEAVAYANVSMSVMKQACIGMLKAGLPIFFGSDVGKYSNSRTGIMDTDLIDYELGFNLKLGMSKAERLRTGESAMTHAMVLTGVHIVDGKPVRWRVQNSWGASAGDAGYFVMSDKWMDEFVYQAVVDPKFVSKEVRDILSKKPKVLPIWDPMGALA